MGQEPFERVERLVGAADASQQNTVQVVFVVIAVGQFREKGGRFGRAVQCAGQQAQLRNAAAQYPAGVDVWREAGGECRVAGVGQCVKSFGNGHCESD